MNRAEQLKDIIKKLEGVFKISTDAKQKERVKKEISSLRAELKKIESKGEDILTEEESLEKVHGEERKEEKKEKEDENTEDEESYPLLGNNKIEKIHPLSDDYEINLAATYLKKFEDELWGVLSDFHLKLDYNHSKERDKFYNGLEGCIRLMNDYIDVLDEFSKSTSDAYKERLRLMKLKVGRAFLIELTEFMNDLHDFVSYLISDNTKGGNIILNPDEIIRFSKLEGEKKELDNIKVIESLKYVRDFTEEFMDKIKIPDEILSIKKSI